MKQKYHYQQYSTLIYWNIEYILRSNGMKYIVFSLLRGSSSFPWIAIFWCENNYLRRNLLLFFEILWNQSQETLHKVADLVSDLVTPLSEWCDRSGHLTRVEWHDQSRHPTSEWHNWSHHSISEWLAQWSWSHSEVGWHDWTHHSIVSPNFRVTGLIVILYIVL